MVSGGKLPSGTRGSPARTTICVSRAACRQSTTSSASAWPIRIHQRSTRAMAAAGVVARVHEEPPVIMAAAVRTTAARARQAARRGEPATLLLGGGGAFGGRGGLPAERAEDLVGRREGLVRQRLLEPLLVVGLDPLDLG